MNLSDSNQISHFYEQMLIQRNLVVQQQMRQNESLQLQILNKSNSSSSSSASSTSSLLSISSKSQQPSPNNSLVSEKSESPESKPRTNEFETTYHKYMFSAFPYNFFTNFASSTPIMSQPKPITQQQVTVNTPNTTNKPTSSQSNHNNHHQHHYHHSNQNIYRPNGKSEEAKPTHSYIGLIALAILSAPEKKLVLSDIYQWILDNYSYFHSRGSGWRNSIRHNLSLNDCFMKSGRSSNGKGHYWTIHPANMEDFMKGDFRRRRAQRRVRKSLGLTVPEEDEEDDDILTPPSSLSPVQKCNNYAYAARSANSLINSQFVHNKSKLQFYNFQSDFAPTKRNNPNEETCEKKSKVVETATSDIESISEEGSNQSEEIDIINSNSSFCEKESKSNSKKRSFNMDSLLAPDVDVGHKKIKTEYLETDNELNKEWQSTKRIKSVNELAGSEQAKIKSTKSDQINTNLSISKGEFQNEDVEQWKLTFSKIMARSYKNSTTLNTTNHSISGLVKK